MEPHLFTGRDSIRIMVENVQISAQCEDNPHFANCKLIVRAQYCTNKYYAKFYCRSCTIGGQLRSERGGRGRGEFIALLNFLNSKWLCYITQKHILRHTHFTHMLHWKPTIAMNMDILTALWHEVCLMKLVFE